jgi:hypothetical protein
MYRSKPSAIAIEVVIPRMTLPEVKPFIFVTPTVRKFDPPTSRTPIEKKSSSGMGPLAPEKKQTYPGPM